MTKLAVTVTVLSDESSVCDEAGVVLVADDEDTPGIVPKTLSTIAGSKQPIPTPGTLDIGIAKHCSFGLSHDTSLKDLLGPSHVAFRPLMQAIWPSKQASWLVN